MRAWFLAHRLLRESLTERGAKLVSLVREGSHGARASIRTATRSYRFLHASVPTELTDRVAIDGALAFLLVECADSELGPRLVGRSPIVEAT